MAELKNILEELRGVSNAGMDKTASAEQAAPKLSAAQDELQKALSSALTSVEKTAAPAQEKAASATDELTKIAQDLANADQEALTKEANLFGACVMDGFVARGRQYGLEIDQTDKTASAEQQPTPAELEKWAKENPEEFRRQYQQGYVEGEQMLKDAQAQDLQKLASTPEGQEAIRNFNTAYEQTAQELQKLASTPEGQEKVAAFQKGYQDTMAQLNTIAQSEGGAEKLASVQEGFKDGTEQIEKLAEDYYTRGYNDTAALLNAGS